MKHQHPFPLRKGCTCDSFDLCFYAQKTVYFQKHKTHLKLYQNAILTLTFYILIISCKNEVAINIHLFKDNKCPCWSAVARS